MGEGRWERKNRWNQGGGERERKREGTSKSYMPMKDMNAKILSISLSVRQSKNMDKNIFLVDSRCHPQSVAVVKTRANYLGVEVLVEDYRKFDFSSGHVCGALVQYPNTDGQINDYTDMIINAHKNGVSTCSNTYAKRTPLKWRHLSSIILMLSYPLLAILFLFSTNSPNTSIYCVQTWPKIIETIFP